MTIREVYENVLTELNKVQAPSLLLQDFNYLLNKGIQQYFNKRYSAFEINQQLTDDLRVLTKTSVLEESEHETSDILGESHKFFLPNDYVHILNCICKFQNNDSRKCNSNTPTIEIGADKLDSNKWSSIITNYYMKPSIKKPYYYISNIDEPTAIEQALRYPFNGESEAQEQRLGNSSKPVLEIKCGDLNKQKSRLIKVYIDYLRAPKYIELTEDALNEVEDNTPHLEFPDYVIYEIINEMVTLILENTSNARIQTFPAVTTSTIPQTQK